MNSKEPKEAEKQIPGSRLPGTFKTIMGTTAKVEQKPEDEIKPDFDFSTITPDSLKSELITIASDSSKGLFKVQTASKWIEEAKLRPIPKRLFGDLWFEGELCILFSDTNLGKSIKAVQIGDSITRGTVIPGFSMECEPQKVVYFDFELSDKQFEGRYSQNFENHYSFSENFLRAERDPDHLTTESDEINERFLYESFEKVIVATSAKILIVDNITYLKSETEKAKFALPLMKYLQSLKKKFSLAILVLAHCPKRDLSKPISRNDLQGSKMLINFCDSCFAIGESFQDKTIRYLKQIKARSSEIVFDSENVCLCQIEKPANFLQFTFVGYGCEREHLRVPTSQDREAIIAKTLELHSQKKSQRQIAEELGISLGVVNKYIRSRVQPVNTVNSTNT